MKRTTLIAAGIGAAAVFGVAGTTLAGAALADPGDPSPGAVATTAPSGALSVAPSATSSTGVPSGAAPVSGAVTEAQAREIAIRAAGGGQVTGIEAETEHDRPVWEVDVQVGNVEHDMDVDRETGEVRDHEQETDDQDDDNDNDDD